MGRAFEFRKGRKLKRWASMAKIFTKVNRDVTIAVKEAGPDPETNAKLRIAIQNARSLSILSYYQEKKYHWFYDWWDEGNTRNARLLCRAPNSIRRGSYFHSKYQ